MYGPRPGWWTRITRHGNLLGARRHQGSGPQPDAVRRATSPADPGDTGARERFVSPAPVLWYELTTEIRHRATGVMRAVWRSAHDNERRRCASDGDPRARGAPRRVAVPPGGGDHPRAAPAAARPADPALPGLGRARRADGRPARLGGGRRG